MGRGIRCRHGEGNIRGSLKSLVVRDGRVGAKGCNDRSRLQSQIGWGWGRAAIGAGVG